MADASSSLQDELEWQLVSGTTSSLDRHHAGPSRTRELANWLAKAEFRSILLSNEAAELFSDYESHLFEGVKPIVSIGEKESGNQVNGASKSADLTRDSKDLIRLIVAIALIHVFAQANWTGPDLNFKPADLPLPAGFGAISDSDLNAAAIPLLTLGGEPAYHLARDPILLILAKRILNNLSSSSSPAQPAATPKSDLQTLPWWILRAHSVHLALLDEPVALPPQQLEQLQSLIASIPSSQQDLLACAHIELGLYHHQLGNDKLANQSFLAAAKASGLKYELTGALGRKTKFQPDAISQLVLLAESRQRDNQPSEASSSPLERKNEGAEKTGLPETMALNDDTLLEETEFTKTASDATDSSIQLSHLDPSDQPPLHPLDQSLLIDLCLNTHNSLPSSGLTSSQMMPFISRVISHPNNWSVHTTALLLRSRLEANRSRTVERSTLQLAALIEQMPTSDSTPVERLRYFHQLPLPSRWEMERELAKRYLSVGVTRSALEIFTRLEMWEDVVGCLQRLDQEDEAEKVVRDLLQGRKVESDLIPAMTRMGVSEERKHRMSKAREGKLWCLLGDVLLSSEASQRDPTGTKQEVMGCYDKAWQVSGKTSSRSRRSLGSLYVGAGDFEKAIPILQDAVAINPQYSRVWFTLGVCFVRLERWAEARDAFRRQVGVDEEDAEGWNNLAAVYLRLGEQGIAEAGEQGHEGDHIGDLFRPEKGGRVLTDDQLKSITYEHKLLAFRAIRTGLRFSPTNWRMWANYMLVCIDVGELAESVRAMTRLIENHTSTGQAIDIEVLDKLVDSVTRDDWNNGTPLAPPTTSDEGFGLLPILERLFDVTILPRISDDARLWRCHARLLRWKEDWAGAMEDHLKAYRVGIASEEGVVRDESKFKEAVVEVEELIGVLEVLGPKAKVQKEREAEGKRVKGDWKFTAKGIVRTFMGRTKES